MKTPEDNKYAKSHEYINVEGDIGTIGITDYAQKELGDVVFVELPQVGTQLEANEEMGSIESVKAVSELFAPVSGEVIEVNEDLADKPELVNTDAWGLSRATRATARAASTAEATAVGQLSTSAASTPGSPSRMRSASA